MDAKLKLSTLLLCALLSACEESTTTTPENKTSSTDELLSGLIQQKGLRANPMAGKAIPSVNQPVVQLGKRLFFSKSLSGNRDTACVSCHHPMLGGGDDLSLPIGVEAVVSDLLGPGRSHRADAVNYDGGPTVPRNAPTTFNLAGWNTFMFHDGRVEQHENETIRTPDAGFGTADPIAGQNLVQAQARFPVTSKEEMKGFEHEDKNNQQIRQFLAERLGGYGNGVRLLQNNAYWLELFRDAYQQPYASAPALITEQNIAFALGEYQQSQVFVSSPWQQYVRGNVSALSDSAKRGAVLFFASENNGGVGCSSCHSGDFFTDEGFHNIGIPQLGHGKGDGDDGSEDFGRYRESGAEMDKFAFRTPSLLNVEVTGPWGHSGAYTSLENIIAHHLQPRDTVGKYDSSQLSQVGVQNLDKLQRNTQAALNHSNFALSNQGYSYQNITDLVSFLKALTDPCTKSKSCLTPWILNEYDNPDPNGDQLTAIGL